MKAIVRVWYSDPYSVPLPEGHRFPMGKYQRLRELLLERGVLNEHLLELSLPIERHLLLCVHTAEYVSACFDGTLDEAALRRVGFPWSHQLLQRSLASAGGTLSAARWALHGGVAGNLAGGTHHAHADFGSGYCVFNDLAVASATLLNERLVERVLIVDLDVHQGDGTAAIFKTEPRVFTFSMHGAKNFPFRKQVSTRDIELPDGCDDSLYLALLDEHLPQVFESCAPSLVLYQAGVDALREDALGRLHLTHAGLRERDRRVFDLCWSRAVPVVVTLGGGYAKPIEASVEASVGTYVELRRRYG
jgi:acetoin utilization deacetylase AcuC-like enzyme